MRSTVIVKNGSDSSISTNMCTSRRNLMLGAKLGDGLASKLVKKMLSYLIAVLTT